MSNITTANESNPEALKSYFTKYPDVPKETILKQHLLSLGHGLAMPRSTPRRARWSSRIDYSCHSKR